MNAYPIRRKKEEMNSNHKRKLGNISGRQLRWKFSAWEVVGRSWAPAHSGPDPDAVINPFYAAGLPRRFQEVQARWLGDHASRSIKES